jgi:hypothetical protein
MTQAADNYIQAHSKSKGVSAVLTVLLGPLGLFYASPISPGPIGRPRRIGVST